MRPDWAAVSSTGGAAATGAGASSAANGFLASAIAEPTASIINPVALMAALGSGPLPRRGAFQSFNASIVRFARLRLWRMRNCV